MNTENTEIKKSTWKSFRYTPQGRPIVANPHMIKYSEGEYVLYSDSMKEIERRDEQISLLLKTNEQDEKENEYLHQEIEELKAKLKDYEDR
jgi:hypothetical protein